MLNTVAPFVSLQHDRSRSFWKEQRSNLTVLVTKVSLLLWQRCVSEILKALALLPHSDRNSIFKSTHVWPIRNKKTMPPQYILNVWATSPWFHVWRRLTFKLLDEQVEQGEGGRYSEGKTENIPQLSLWLTHVRFSRYLTLGSTFRTSAEYTKLLMPESITE